MQAPTWTVVAISSVPWFATTVKGTFGDNAGGIVATVVSADLAFVYVWKKMLQEFSRRKRTLKTRFTRFFFKVIRYSFPVLYQYFSIALKVIFSLSDRYKIFTSNWLWIEIYENLVLSKIDITMTKINKNFWNW